MTQNNKETLSEVIKRNEEEFAKEIYKNHKSCHFSTPCAICSGCGFELKIFLRSSQESIVAWVREWAEKKKKEIVEGYFEDGTMEYDSRNQDIGYNQALSDLLAELQEPK